MALRLQSKLEKNDRQRIKDQLQARVQHQLSNLPVTSLQRAEVLMKAEVQM